MAARTLDGAKLRVILYPPFPATRRTLDGTGIWQGGSVIFHFGTTEIGISADPS